MSHERGSPGRNLRAGVVPDGCGRACTIESMAEEGPRLGGCLPVLRRALAVLASLMTGAPAAAALVEGCGQAGGPWTHVARFPDHDAFIEPTGALIVPRARPGDAVAFRFEDASGAAAAGGIDAGNRHGAAPTEAAVLSAVGGGVTFPRVFPGIDVTWHPDASGDGLEWDVHLEEAATLGRLHVVVVGGLGAFVDERGRLAVPTASGVVRQCVPAVWEQGATGRWARRTGRFEQVAADVVRIRVDGTAPGSRLVVDPVITYQSFLGSEPWEGQTALAIDPATGRLAVTGSTRSLADPTLSPLGGSQPGGWDAFVRILDARTRLEQGVFLGGTDLTAVLDADFDREGNLVLVGDTLSGDFPATAGAFQRSFAGERDAIVAKMAPDGTLVFATFLGGADMDSAVGVDVDDAGDIHVTGWTRSPRFPTTRADLGATGGDDVFVATLSPDGATLTFGMRLGGDQDDQGLDIAVDASGRRLVGGQTLAQGFPLVDAQWAAPGGGWDGFLLALDPTGAALEHSTLVPGPADQAVVAVALDSEGRLWFGGGTRGAGLPAVSPLQGFGGGTSDGFVGRMLPGGSVDFLSPVGGSEFDTVFDLHVGPGNLVAVGGGTWSDDLPVVRPTSGSRAGEGDGWLGALRADAGGWSFLSYLGASATEAVHSVGVESPQVLVVAGATKSEDLPMIHATQPAFGGGTGDAFVAKACLADPPTEPVRLIFLSKPLPPALVRFRWDETADAQRYVIHGDTRRFRTPFGVVGMSPRGAPSHDLAMPPDPLVYYQVVGAAQCAEGPR